jgi:hypothetical protein
MVRRIPCPGGGIALAGLLLRIADGPMAIAASPLAALALASCSRPRRALGGGDSWRPRWPRLAAGRRLVAGRGDVPGGRRAVASTSWCSGSRGCRASTAPAERLLPVPVRRALAQAGGILISSTPRRRADPMGIRAILIGLIVLAASGLSIIAMQLESRSRVRAGGDTPWRPQPAAVRLPAVVADRPRLPAGRRSGGADAGLEFATA